MLRILTLLAGCALASAASAASPDYQAVIDWLETHADAPVDGLAPGTYGRDRLADLARYLPPGYQEELEFDGLRITLVPTAHYQAHPDYQAATAQFAGQAALAADGTLSGHVAGQPFSLEQILAAPERDAGYMVAWNQIHRWQHYGYRNESTIIYVQPTADGSAGTLLEGMHGGGHVDRHVEMFYHRVYLSRLATEAANDYRMDVDGADELFFKEYIEMLAPFDIAGLKIVVERPLDQSLGDQVNSYLPTERRVRRLSAKERADSWIGTQWTLDDFEGFSGMVMDNDWRFIGRKVLLAVANSGEQPPQFHGPMSTVPLDRWQLRRCLVVEAVPHWEDHPYGRRLLFVDEETYNIPMALIFDRDDRLLKIFHIVYAHSDEATDLPAELSTPRWRASIGINVQERGATIAAEADASTEYVTVKPSQVRKLFSISNLSSGR
ncbi:MAG: DUF1329 domain-containing protein [Gammaproteobacteria bacterium]